MSDVVCAFCDRVLGWKYIAAVDAAQRYKVGKVILETRRVRTRVGVMGLRDTDARRDDDEDDNQNLNGEVQWKGKYGFNEAVVDDEDDEEQDSVEEESLEDTFCQNEARLPGLEPKEGEVEFDSQDEDECEDLFLGIWTPALAAKRRRGRRLGR